MRPAEEDDIPVSLAEQIPAPRRITPAITLPTEFSVDGVLIGGVDQEVLSVVTGSRPTMGNMRAIHRDRQANRGIALAVAATAPDGVYLLGPNSEGAPGGPLTVDQAARILNAFIDEPNALSARQRLAALLGAATSSDGLVGVNNAGLFAGHYIKGLPDDASEWADHVEAARPLLALHGHDLISALGYRTEGLGAGALLLTVGDSPVHAVAVMIEESEAFDAPSVRLDASPIQHGLAKAAQQRVPWLIALRGTQIRLYPVLPDIGVGRRSQSETFFELDLAVADDATAGFLSYVFSAGALDDEGTVARLLDASQRYAAALGANLRTRVYEDVIPALAVAVAAELGRMGHADDLDRAYAVTLKVLFRLIFQAYAEANDLLPYNSNERYARHALTTHARDFVADPERALDPESHALWDGLKQVWDVIDTGNADWAVPAYNGGLFSRDAEYNPDGALIADMELADTAVGPALQALLCETGADGAAPVDFRSLSVREFGTIYEGLLESSLSRAEQDLTLNSRKAYVPTSGDDEVVARAGDIYFHNRSGERKATGTYFTKDFIVEHLLEGALDPALDRHLAAVADLLEANDQAGAYEKFFDFRVADLAMGSGHFLIRAVDRIEAKMSAFLTQHPIPQVTNELQRLEQAARAALGEAADDHSLEAAALLRRQIAKRCIYGIDINEMAVELARLALWIHTFVPGLPMSSLDHTLVRGNSLTGIATIEEAEEVLLPEGPGGEEGLFEGSVDRALGQARNLLSDVASSSEATRAEVRRAAEAYASARTSAAPARMLFDAAIGLRSGLAPDLADRIDSEPEWNGDPRLAHLDALHFPEVFPDVLRLDRGGFDVLVGNPPWEKLQVESHAFWARYSPGLRGLPQAAREARIAELVASRPDLVTEFEQLVTATEAMRAVIRSAPYPGLQTGHLDLYQAFAWRNWHLLRGGGVTGMVLPGPAVTLEGTHEWRRAVLDEGSFTEVTLMTNTGGWVFDETEHRYTIALVVATKGGDGAVTYSGPFHSLEEFTNRGEPSAAPREEFATWSDTLTFPRVPDAQAGDILRRMRQHPRFDADDGFEFRPVQEINATTDRPLFDTDLRRLDLAMPVITGASFHIWNPNHGDPYGRASRETMVDHLVAKARRGSRLASSAFSGLDIRSEADHPVSRARISFRDIARSTDSRTAIFCLLPPGVVLVHKAPYLLRLKGTEVDEAYLLGMVCSIPFDWYARRWVENHLSFFVIKPMPVPRPDPDDLRRQRIVEIAGTLAAVDERFEGWAGAVGVPVGGLPGTDKDLAIAELDALAAHLYGLGWDDVEHIFATFHRGWDYRERLNAVREHYERWADR